MTYEDLHDVVLLHGKSIYSFCRHLTENAADADDLYQETFLKAAELCHKINKSQNPRAFLIRISAGIWRNSLRKDAGKSSPFPPFLTGRKRFPLNSRRKPPCSSGKKANSSPSAQSG